MTTSAIHHRPASFVAVAATWLVGALLAATTTSAQAIPDPDSRPSVPDRAVQTDPRYVERPCFITPSTWNEALDGPLPRCRTYVP